MELHAKNPESSEDRGYFDRLIAMAAAICQTPIAFTSYFLAGQQHVSSSIGLCLGPMPSEESICVHTHKLGDLLVVPDLTADERFRQRSYVVGPPHLRFYAGVPIISAAGHAHGALCVVDRVPRQLNQTQMANLRQLAKLLSSSLKIRAA